jgi:hypothetical protein
VLIEGRTVPVDCPSTIGARIHKLSPTTPHNADALELYPRTTGLVSRASDFEVPLTVRVGRSAWAGRPSAPAPRGRACWTGTTPPPPPARRRAAQRAGGGGQGEREHRHAQQNHDPAPGAAAPGERPSQQPPDAARPVGQAGDEQGRAQQRHKGQEEQERLRGRSGEHGGHQRRPAQAQSQEEEDRHGPTPGHRTGWGTAVGVPRWWDGRGHGSSWPVRDDPVGRPGVRCAPTSAGSSQHRAHVPASGPPRPPAPARPRPATRTGTAGEPHWRRPGLPGRRPCAASPVTSPCPRTRFHGSCRTEPHHVGTTVGGPTRLPGDAPAGLCRGTAELTDEPRHRPWRSRPPRPCLHRYEAMRGCTGMQHGCRCW